MDVRMRRNAFGITAGWKELLKPENHGFGLADKIAAAAAAGSVGSGPGRPPAWRGRPVLVLADLALVNLPPAPPANWPPGLLRNTHSYVGIDRSGAGGLQMVGLRSTLVLTEGDVRYLAYWYRLGSSLDAAERQRAAWLQNILEPLQLIGDEDGGLTQRVQIWGGFLYSFNGSLTPIPVRTPSMPADFDCWSAAVPGLLPPLLQQLQRTADSGNASSGDDAAATVRSQVSAAVSAQRPLPIGSFAVAENAAELLELLQDGAALSYNVTLAGPAAGPAVSLDISGLPLVRRVVAAGGSSDGGNGGSPAPVSLLAHRLVVKGALPPLPAVGRSDVVEALKEWEDGDAAAQEAAAGLQAWTDRCAINEAAAGSGDGAAGNASSLAASDAWAQATAALVPLELLNCTLELPADALHLLRVFNDPDACSGNNGTATPAAAATIACSGTATGGGKLGLLSALLGQALLLQGQALVAAKGPPSGTVPAQVLRMRAAAAAAVTSGGAIVTGGSDKSGVVATGRLGSLASSIEAMMQSCQDVMTAAAGELGAQHAARSGKRQQRPRMLGRGAFGVVYLDTWKGLPAAVKVVLLDPVDPEKRLAQLASEVAIAAHLSHPNVVTTYDFSLSAVSAAASEEAQ
ncbi:hypothetical protein GPECTOR_9g705 [Gonium pectorale]|uniref:Protein kinase domain-containing protein n=1 Tax=Gonium pectorale TaxID=33097 RepID=A0A150GTI0_GONPE|nr:hypothetical protein GPECTOR_9g705 [Gonium pectorale]|eukprot:KXZ52660.1 hypothetical protein GPECTOR_9g705 [Gonium pectorale]